MDELNSILSMVSILKSMNSLLKSFDSPGFSKFVEGHNNESCDQSGGLPP